MPDRSSRTWTIASLAALAIVLVMMQVVGLSARRFLPDQRVHVVANAAEGYSALRADGVRGRIVVLLDERTRQVPRTWMATFMQSLSDTSTPPPVMSYNAMSGVAYAGIARSIYFVPPGMFWERELARFTERPDSLPDGNGARLRFNTIPVILQQATDLPVFSEKVVVWVSERTLQGYSPDFIRHLTDPAIADVVIRVKDGQ